MDKPRKQLPKTPTGIQGLDEITGGGLPKGRPTLVCGGAGCGKTLLAMEFLVRGASQYNEPGVFMTFEETAKDLTQNVASLGFDLKDLIARKKIIVNYVYIERSEIIENGEFDLEGLFIRLGHAIDSIGARRVVLDTIESIFSGLPNPLILRAELHRLFRWLKEKGVTAIITGERGEATLTRQGLEEYISDCVIVLDQRIEDQVCSRRLRVVKYRGSTHGTNEYPFLIDEDGISVLPVTSMQLQQAASTKCISTGIARLDAMLGGEVITVAAACWSPGQPALARPAWQPTLPTRPANAVSVPFILLSKNLPARSCATCVRSASIWNSGLRKVCSNSRQHVPRLWGLKCTW
jgi:circadian clock protein KaiC